MTIKAQDQLQCIKKERHQFTVSSMRLFLIQHRRKYISGFLVPEREQKARKRQEKIKPAEITICVCWVSFPSNV